MIVFKLSFDWQSFQNALRRKQAALVDLRTEMLAVGHWLIGNAQWGLMNAEAGKADLLKGANIFKPLGDAMQRLGSVFDEVTRKVSEFGEVVDKAKAARRTPTTRPFPTAGRSGRRACLGCSPSSRRRSTTWRTWHE